MKKFLIILGVVAAIGLTACQGLEKLFAVTDEKIANVATSSPLEKRYTAFGNYEGEVVRYPSDDKLLKTITVYYPKAQNQAFPLVVMANGTGMAVSKYEPVLKHLASWGFVVIGSEEDNSWSGKGANETLNFALKLNEDSSSPLYHKINRKKIGVSGHSQGGVGAINLASNQPLIRSVYTASTTKLGLSVLLKWPYDVSRVKVPYFMTAGAHKSDAGDGKDYNKGIALIMSLNENYAKLSSPAVMAQRVGTDHGGMLWVPNGYMVAWFLYTLNGDTEAKTVFAGNKAELKHNANWTQVKIKNIQ